MFRALKCGASAAAMLSALWAPSVFAITGNQTQGGGIIGLQHINLGAQFGTTVGFIQLNGGTGTGTFVPSAVPGQLKFLTAAHNFDLNNDGVLDSNAPFTIGFGSAQQADGSMATYRITVPASAIALNPAWAPTGSATNDLAVVTFDVSQLTLVQGGPIPTVSPIGTGNPINLTAILAGHGLHGDGTVSLDPNGPPPGTAQPDGVLKAGYNVIDFAGIPVLNAPYTVGATITPNSGTVLLVDFDQLQGAGFNPATSTLNGPNQPGGVQRDLEGGTAAGDSGSALLVDSNGDGIWEVVGVLNGGDNPVNPGVGAGMYGDVSQYAPIFTPANQAFLAAQGVYLGTDFMGVTINGSFVVIDAAALAQAQSDPRASQALAAQINDFRRNGDSAVRIIFHRALRVGQGLSVLGNTTNPPDGNGEAGLLDPDAADIAEVYFSGGVSDGSGSGLLDGQLGIEVMAKPHLLFGAAAGVAGSAGTVTSTSATGYAIGTIDQFMLSGGFAWTGHDVNGAPFMGSTISLDGQQFTVNVGAAANFDVGRVRLTPHTGVIYSYGTTSNGTITTAGVTTALPNVTFDQYRFEGGLTASMTLPRDWGTIVPFLGGNLGYRNTTMPNAVAALGGGSAQPFFGLQQQGNGFVLVRLPTTVVVPGGAAASTATDGAAVYAELNGGVEFQLNNGVSIGLNGGVAYDSIAGAGYSAAVTFGFAF